MPEEAKKTLKGYGDLIELSTSGITYEAISGHPDIFFFQSASRLIAAPNLPGEYFSILDEKKINYTIGHLPAGKKYPETARYNAAASENFLIHRTDITEKKILMDSEDKETLHVKQGYCRCSLLPLRMESFITSDEGIYKALKNRGLNVLYVSPEGILLPGFSHGFIGGACGVSDDRVFITGSLSCHRQADEIKGFMNCLGYETVELYDGPLFDVGSIIFLN
jgi:hypothetical protein